MKSVLILMSTYNGEKKIYKQVESLFSQEYVEISLYVRDDGSTSRTKQVLDALCNKYKDRMTVVYGENIGWKRSFMELLYTAKLDYDYYGFSDQDDVWLLKKIVNCIECAEKDLYDIPKLVHCNSLSVTPMFERRDEQELRCAEPDSFKSAIAMEYFQGCGMLWNRKAMQLIRKYRPKEMNLAHDYWVGLICYFFGKIYFCEEPQFYHIRYENNSSEDGNVNKGRLKRIKMLVSGQEAYMNPCKDLLEGYSDIFAKEQKDFLKDVIRYKIDFRCKCRIIFDKNFRRKSKLSTAAFKMAIICNKY